MCEKQCDYEQEYGGGYQEESAGNEDHGNYGGADQSYGGGGNASYEHSQKTRDADPMLVQCWTTVFDTGPASNQHWFNSSCLLGWV